MYYNMYILTRGKHFTWPIYFLSKFWIKPFRTATKSATVICAVGITFGLGGYILYKLYCRFIQPLLKKPPKKKKSEKRNESKEPQDINGIKIETSMGNTTSNKPETSAYFSPVTGVALHVGRKSRSRDSLKTESSRTRQRKRTKRRKTSAENDLTRSAPVEVPLSGSDLSINHTSDVSNIDLEGSLKANVSLQSLTDRNMRDIESFRQSSGHYTMSIPQLGAEAGNPDQSSDSNMNVKLDNLSNKENCDTVSGGKKFHIEVSDDLLTVSSVLLTPPSEDDVHINSNRMQNNHSLPRNPQVLQDHNQIVQHNMSSYSSDYNTDSKKSCTDNNHISAADESCSCDEKDSVSSLPKLRSPDRYFRESLLHRLQECHNGAGSSNSSSLDSSPEFSPYARNRKYSIDMDNLSGLATPDSEIFNCDVGRSTEDQFEHLEEEVLDIEEEFLSLTNKLNQLKNIATNSDSSSLEYSPSHPLAKKAVEIIDRTKNRLSRSRSVSVSSNDDSSPACSFDMPDLSWDSEGLHGDNSNKSTPNSRRSGEQTNSLRNRLQARLLSKSTNGYNGGSFESPMETDVERDGTLDNLSTDDCFDFGSNSDWSKETSSERYSKTESSAKESSGTNSIQMSSSEACSSSVYESAQDSVPTSESMKNGHVGITNLNGNNLTPKQKPGSKNGTTAVQVSEKVDITSYVEKEWKGKTEKANTIRQAYLVISKETGCGHLRRIRGDNYCGLRGTLFQCLCQGLDLSRRWPSLNNITDSLAKRYSDSNSGLKHWTFANRFSCEDDQRLSLMSQCISMLFSKFEEAKSCDTQSDKELWTINLLNSDPDCDLHLMEGLKLLMFLHSLDLYDMRETGEDIPMFVWLLFARDTSETPLMFVQNHLNVLGDSGGIEQIEMYLLGHTLGVRIQVIRLSQFGQEDFLAYYPDDSENNWSQISLIAEDDRHYNVPVP